MTYSTNDSIGDRDDDSSTSKKPYFANKKQKTTNSTTDVSAAEKKVADNLKIAIKEGNNNKIDDDGGDVVNMLGVSVHWLKTGFMNEVKVAGHTAESKIYEIEDLGKLTGVIRNKGKDVISPIDGRKGAAYVHSLHGDDNVGRATVMLSYAWGYTVGMIIQTLEDWCHSKGKDLKRTYVRICCLCVNQHRVAEKKNSGITVSSEEFFDEFGKCVESIGTILALMEPWDSPKYLSRIWCVYEVYWAHVHNCNVEIIMPQKQKELMTKSIVGTNNSSSSSSSSSKNRCDEEDKNSNFCKEKKGIDKLYEVLSNIDVEKANASVQEDREKILEMIRKDGGYTKLNNIVNDLLRSWVRKSIDELVLQKSIEVNNDKGDTTRTKKSKVEDSYGDLCYNVGRIFYRHGEYEESMKMHKQCLDIRLKLYGKNHEKTASVYNNIGNVLRSKGDDDNALIQYKKALSIQLARLGEGHPYVATTHSFIGNILWNKGDYDNALIQHNKALMIYKTKLGENHSYVATTFNNIANVLADKGDYNNAFIQYKKVLAIKLKKLGQDHPNVATTYNNIGTVLKDKSDYDNAVIQFQKALAIYKSNLGEDHPYVATTYSCIGAVLKHKGDYNNALSGLNKALEIFTKIFGEDHQKTKNVLKWIEFVVEEKEQISKQYSS